MNLILSCALNQIKFFITYLIYEKMIMNVFISIMQIGFFTAL